jgi:hypothetical protein
MSLHAAVHLAEVPTLLLLPPNPVAAHPLAHACVVFHTCCRGCGLQGVLSSAAERWPHIHISDSLVMADRAVKMVEAGCT